MDDHQQKYKKEKCFDKEKEIELNKIIIQFQSLYRKYICQQELFLMKNGFIKLQSLCRKRIAKQQFLIIKNGIIKLQSLC